MMGRRWGSVSAAVFRMPRSSGSWPRLSRCEPARRFNARPMIVIVMTATAAIVGGCAVGPEFAPPAPPDVSGYTQQPLPARTASAAVAGGAAQQFVKGRDIPGDWWRVFGSRSLKSLVERALRNNPDLAAAQAALRIAQANLGAGTRRIFPPSRWQLQCNAGGAPDPRSSGRHRANSTVTDLQSFYRTGAGLLCAGRVRGHSAQCRVTAGPSRTINAFSSKPRI